MHSVEDKIGLSKLEPWTEDTPLDVRFHDARYLTRGEGGWVLSFAPSYHDHEVEGLVLSMSMPIEELRQLDTPDVVGKQE